LSERAAAETIFEWTYSYVARAREAENSSASKLMPFSRMGSHLECFGKGIDRRS